jgi:hypothetical protein
MYKRTVEVTPDKPNFPLTPVWVGMNGAALFSITGLPTETESARLWITKVGASVAVYFDATWDETEEVWYAYAGGANFPTVGQGSYEVEFEDDEGRTFWSGRGVLSVLLASGGGTVGAGTPADSYVRNPITGLYHKVTVRVNELGEFTTEVSQTGEGLL